MRKIIRFLCLVVMLLSLIGFGTLAASTRPGVKAGIANSRAAVSGELPGIQLKSISGISGGVFLGLDFGKGRFGIQPEVLFTVRGFDARESHQGQDISSVYEIDTVEIPVLFSYRLISGKRMEPVLLVGPYFGFPLKVREIQTVGGQTEERELDDNLIDTDMGMVFGIDLRYDLRTIQVVLAARFHWGLTNISRDIQAVSYDLNEDDTMKNRSLFLMVGIAFDLRRSSR